MPSEPLSAAERAALRAEHTRTLTVAMSGWPTQSAAQYCALCGVFGGWPCPVERLLDALEQREALIEQARAVMAGLMAGDTSDAWYLMRDDLLAALGQGAQDGAGR